MITEGQKLALDQLQKISQENDYALEIIGIKEPQGEILSVCVEISLHCGHFKKAHEGLPLRERERFRLYIQPDFPFSKPNIYTCHQRFAGRPHVQWKTYMCLYQSTEAEWIPSDGMFGFIKRLEDWLEKGALDELDQTGEALHPPVTYTNGISSTILVPQKNTPSISVDNWIGLANLQRINNKALAITDWSEISKDTKIGYYAPSILLAQPMPFEFPDTVADLLIELKKRNVSFNQLLLSLQLGVLWKNDNEPFFLIIGSPMRGVKGSEQLKQHLTAWEIDNIIVKGLKISLEKYSNNSELQEIGEKAVKIIEDWTKTAKVKWCDIQESREEIVTRRDYKSSLSGFKGKCISIWGCGALGANIAIYLARAGIRKIILRDNGLVTPGILVRQPFTKEDIGFHKVDALEKHLNEINNELLVEKHTNNIKSWLLSNSDWSDSADFVIDSTASNIVHTAFEIARMNETIDKVPLVSLIIDRNATHGIAILIGKDFSGGTFDVYRKAMISINKEDSLKIYADAFYPDPDQEKEKPFQPEPGCSDPTFIGSAADTAALSSMLLNACTEIISLNNCTASAQFISRVQRNVEKTSASYIWDNDKICKDLLSDYEVRISQEAWKEITTSINQNNRTNSEKHETGGLLFGKRDDVLKLLWIDDASGPPPDSESSPDKFICGISGTRELNRVKKERSRKLVSYIGNWHTHPGLLPIPSNIDIAGIAQILEADDFSMVKNFLLIIQPLDKSFNVGGFLFSKDDFTKDYIEVRCPLNLAKFDDNKRTHKIGLALSGGGSRAIAFHLGCMRALYDRGLLDSLDVISAVSGGSVIAAMFAFSNDSFEEFDNKVNALLKEGLDTNIAKEFLLSKVWVHELLTYLIKMPTSVYARLTGRQPFFRRPINRTSSFIKVLAKKFFGNKNITDDRRNNINIVINATELVTGTSFRFGSKESACWRLGKVDGNNVSLAEAVAASAAYPLFLPPVEKEMTFIKDGKSENKYVILSDGGIYENLGVKCLLPDRDPKYSSNLYNPDYIICCNAGYGMFRGDFIPFSLVTRLKQVFETTMRKVQDSVMKELHHHKESGKIKGFILPYLGQQDKQLPFFWPDLVKRDEVNYPTDFRPMKEKDINKISNRGEQLTRLLIDYYCPEL